MTSIADYAKELYDLRAEKDQLEDRLKELNHRKNELERDLIPSMMDDLEQDKVTITGIGTIYLRPDLFANYVKDDEEEVFKWLRENGHGDIIKPTIHYSTLRAWAKEQLENNGAVPTQLRVTPFMQATLRRK